MGSVPAVGPTAGCGAARWRARGRRDRGVEKKRKKVQAEWVGSRKKLGEAWVLEIFWVLVSELALGPPKCISMTNPSVLVVFLLGSCHLVSILVTKVTCDLLL